jgi:hypothetical protein
LSRHFFSSGYLRKIVLGWINMFAMRRNRIIETIDHN